MTEESNVSERPDVCAAKENGQAISAARAEAGESFSRGRGHRCGSNEWDFGANGRFPNAAPFSLTYGGCDPIPSTADTSGRFAQAAVSALAPNQTHGQPHTGEEAREQP